MLPGHLKLYKGGIDMAEDTISFGHLSKDGNSKEFHKRWN
jgi:hypothetical protein